MNLGEFIDTYRDAIRGAALSLEAHRGTTVVGEVGTGKTFIAAAAAHMAGFQRILVLGPPMGGVFNPAIDTACASCVTPTVIY